MNKELRINGIQIKPKTQRLFNSKRKLKHQPKKQDDLVENKSKTIISYNKIKSLEEKVDGIETDISTIQIFIDEIVDKYNDSILHLDDKFSKSIKDLYKKYDDVNNIIDTPFLNINNKEFDDKYNLKLKRIQTLDKNSEEEERKEYEKNIQRLEEELEKDKKNSSEQIVEKIDGGANFMYFVPKKSFLAPAMPPPKMLNFMKKGGNKNKFTFLTEALPESKINFSKRSVEKLQRHSVKYYKTRNLMAKKRKTIKNKKKLFY